MYPRPGTWLGMLAALLVSLCMTASVAAETGTERRDGYVTVNGVNHYYEIVGEGEPFVILHGGPGMYHDELVPFFLDFAAGRQLIFYDQRGNGRSEMREISAETFNTEVLVDDLEKLRASLGFEKWNVIGHSWGGLLALYYAEEYPDRVSRLITISAAPVTTELLIDSYRKHVSRFTPEEWAHIESLWESDAYMQGDPATHNLAMRLSEGATFNDKSYVDDYMAHAAFDERTARNAVALGPLATRMKLTIAAREKLGQITAPTLMVQGREDFIVEEAPVLAQSLIPNAEIAWIEESGHYPHIEKHDETMRILTDFIARTGPN